MQQVEHSKIDEEEDDEDYQTHSPKKQQPQQVLDTTKSDRVITNPTKKAGNQSGPQGIKWNDLDKLITLLQN